MSSAASTSSKTGGTTIGVDGIRRDRFEDVAPLAQRKVGEIVAVVREDVEEVVVHRRAPGLPLDLARAFEVHAASAAAGSSGRPSGVERDDLAVEHGGLVAEAGVDARQLGVLAVMSLPLRAKRRSR